MNVAKKEAALDKIRKDPEYTVILIRLVHYPFSLLLFSLADDYSFLSTVVISIKAGAVGLNLTECSRVILMDLWWNPQIQVSPVFLFLLQLSLLILIYNIYLSRNKLLIEHIEWVKKRK